MPIAVHTVASIMWATNKTTRSVGAFRNTPWRAYLNVLEHLASTVLRGSLKEEASGFENSRHLPRELELQVSLAECARAMQQIQQRPQERTPR